VSLAVLVVANLIPLFGVLLLGWDVRTVQILYWVENGVVGLLNIPKILFAAGPRTSVVAAWLREAGNVVQAIFFVFNYGFFWVIHGIFVVVLTGLFTRTGFFGFPDPFKAVLSEPGLWVAAIALLLGHGADLIVNYFGRGEYRTTSAVTQTFEPYPRMIALHVTIVFGGLAIAVVGQPVALVALLVIVKTVLDVSLYLRQRRRVVTANAGQTVVI
jgi:hypothetical protein